jgi:pimeloyl-ACP methyl ester carboxylesterase
MKLFYRKLGEGPPIIILHGLYGSSDNWMSIARKLSDTYTIFLPDQRNHGRSPHSMRHDYSDMTTDLEEFVNENINGKFSLLGHSMGGKTAISFALKNPALLDSLIVADISPFSRHPDDFKIVESHMKIIRILLHTDLESAMSREEAENKVLAEFQDKRLASFLLKSIYRNETGNFAWRINAPAIFNNLETLMAGLELPDTGPSGVTGFPVLFIRGGDSDYLPESHFADLHSLFPAAEIHTLSETGHWLHAEKPEEFTNIVRKFLAGNY